MATNERSQRTPGYKHRPVDADAMAERAKDSIDALEVHADNEVGIPVRTARKEDARKARDRG